MPGRTPGFTLVELLTVIAIVALLAILFVPLGSKLIEKSRASACASNLRQIGVAMNLYAAENTDSYPRMGFETGETNSWQEKLIPYCGMQPDAMGAPPKPRSAGIFLCPALIPKENRSTAYGMNFFMSPKYYPDKWGYRRVVIPEPARTIIVGEKNYNADQVNAENSGQTTAVEFRHSGSANYLLADGHVEFRKKTDEVPPRSWGWW